MLQNDTDTQNNDPTEKRAPTHSDSNLNQLRAQIKKVMIPLLIRIFELKLAVQQSKTPPSRLQVKQQESTEEIASQLLTLQEDLKLLQLWCHSCQKQVERALNEASFSTTTPKYSQNEDFSRSLSHT